MNSKQTLSRELLQAGAKSSETDRLVQLAGRINRLKPTGTASIQANSRQAHQHNRRLVPLLMASVVGVLAGAIVVAYSQTSLPGNWLYPAKRASEAVAVKVDPNYRATLMMRRSQEVEVLVSRRANLPVILATLADYRTEATAYRSSNYAAFEFCKNNLEQAANLASAPERAAITDTLSSLQT